MKLIQGDKKDCPHCTKVRVEYEGLSKLMQCPYPENHTIDISGTPLTMEIMERALFKLKYGKVARVLPKEKE